MCDTGQVTFPFGGLFFTQSMGEPAQRSSHMVHTPPVSDVSQESIEMKIPRPQPRFMKSESLQTGPRNLHVQFTPCPPAQVTHSC